MTFTIKINVMESRIAGYLRGPYMSCDDFYIAIKFAYLGRVFLRKCKIIGFQTDCRQLPAKGAAAVDGDMAVSRCIRSRTSVMGCGPRSMILPMMYRVSFAEKRSFSKSSRNFSYSPVNVTDAIGHRCIPSAASMNASNCALSSVQSCRSVFPL